MPLFAETASLFGFISAVIFLQLVKAFVASLQSSVFIWSLNSATAHVTAGEKVLVLGLYE